MQIFSACIRRYDFACYTNITEKHKYKKNVLIDMDVNSLSHYDTFETLILCILKSCKLSFLNLHSLILLGLYSFCDTALKIV